MNTYGRGVHDVGGIEIDVPVEVNDKPLQYWEQSIHALLVVLSKMSPPLLTTDELRRGVESLEEASYINWSYYEKWSAAMATILLQNHTISQTELDEEMTGDDANDPADSAPLYATGDRIQVKSEDTRIRWRKPHLRCPGYIFGCIGTVEKYVGTFEDPFLLAFRGSGPPQHLYIISFSPTDIWPEGKGSSDSANDRVTVEIYESWIQPVPESSAACDSNVVFSSNRGQGMVGSGDSSVLPPVPPPHTHHENHLEHSAHSNQHSDIRLTHSHDQHIDSQHSHDHDHHSDMDHTHSHDLHSDSNHAHNHSHDHVHEDRVTVECRAIDKEPVDGPGKVVGEALLRVLYKKGITSPAIIRDTVGLLERAGERLLGADIVVKAWTDGAFKAQLLADAAAAAKSLDIATSNPNAPTVLQVMECTPEVHHVCVCTLCSCYPSSLLGLSPSWYKSRSYRSRTIREPRKVLAEFGTVIPPEVSIHVHDSTADCRYLVIPLRPAGTEDWSDDELRGLVTRDSMIGVSVLKVPGAEPPV